MNYLLAHSLCMHACYYFFAIRMGRTPKISTLFILFEYNYYSAQILIIIISLGRTHINSCDFSVNSYSFDDTEDDFNLDEFDDEVTHDLDSGMVDMMLLATKTLRESYPKEAQFEYGGMRIIASPWSPPAWMKAPTYRDVRGASHAQNMTGSAENQPVCLRDGVGKDSKYAKSWALYFSKFLSACEKLCAHPFFYVL